MKYINNRNLYLENRITSLRLVTLLMLFYLIGYFLKSFFLFEKSFTDLISNSIARYITSVFSAIVSASALLVTYVHKDHLNKMIGEKYKLFNVLPYVIFLFDVLMMLLIFDVIKSKTFRLVFISILYAVCGLLLISIFKALYKQEQASIKQERAKVEQKEAEQKQKTAFKCVCGAGFASQKALSGHQGKCKIYKESKKQVIS